MSRSLFIANGSRFYVGCCVITFLWSREIKCYSMFHTYHHERIYRSLLDMNLLLNDGCSYSPTALTQCRTGRWHYQRFKSSLLWCFIRIYSFTVRAVEWKKIFDSLVIGYAQVTYQKWLWQSTVKHNKLTVFCKDVLLWVTLYHVLCSSYN